MSAATVTADADATATFSAANKTYIKKIAEVSWKH